MRPRRLARAFGAALVVVRLAPALARAPALDNVTALEGTWASGSGSVTTGATFFDPATAAFTIPPAAGIAYSFTADGFFEQSKYIYQSNATVNRCVKASLIWQHGTYTINPNSSIHLEPWKTDGKIMIIDACGVNTVTQYYYYQPELIPMWYNYIEPDAGFAPPNDSNHSTSNLKFALQFFQEGKDGQTGKKMPTMYLYFRPPNMLPTQQLREQVLNPSALSLSSASAQASPTKRMNRKKRLSNQSYETRL